MSAKFDWNQFEQVTSPGKEESNSFDWNEFEAVPEETQHLSLFSGKRLPTARSLEEGKLGLKKAAKVVGSTIAGIPGDIAKLGSDAASYLAEKITGQKAPILSKLLEAQSPPSSQKISSEIEGVFPQLAAQTPQEKEWEDNLSLLTSLVTPFPVGKTKAVNPKHLKALYQAGKELGLSEKQLTPLLHGRISEGILGKLASQGKSAAKELYLTQNALGSVYEGLKAKGKSHISLKAVDKLEDQLRAFRRSFERTVSPSAEKKSLINFLQEAEKKLETSGATGEELINFFQDVNRTVNWKSIDGGKKQLAKVKEFIKEALFSSDKELAKNFIHANDLWAKSESVLKAVKPKRFQEFISISAPAALVGALATGNIGIAKGLALSIAAKSALSKVATKLLTDPKWQNLHGKMLQVIKNKSPKAAQVTIQTLKKRVEEEMPEESGDLEDAFSS